MPALLVAYSLSVFGRTTKLFLAWSLLLVCGICSAEFRAQEPLIYPAGFPTADVLHPKEKIFAPHGWASYGVAPRLTATVDWLTTTFGVPAGAVRYQVGRNRDATYAAELYGLYAPRSIDTNRDHDFKVTHKGGISWLHLMRTSSINEKTRLHLYVGAAYMHFLVYTPKDHPFIPNAHTNVWTPEGGMALERSVNRALKLNANVYYGNSFYYFDQDPRKYMLTYGFYWTPFSTRHHPFLSNMRLEINGYWAYIPDASFHQFSIPFYPILTWQW